jgi:hypothetical protein
MRPTRYGLYETATMRRSRAIRDAANRRFYAGIVAELAAEAEQAEMREQLYERDFAQALKGREPFPEPCTARQDFEHATTQALARLLHAVPSHEWCNAAECLRREISRKAGLCSCLEHYLEDRNFPF